LEEPLYHVVLQGRKVGPYDRRTIVGMRIKKTLTSDDVLIDRNGDAITVGHLIGTRPRAGGFGFQPNRTNSYSLVQATYPASLTAQQGKGHRVPDFKGEIEARIQSGVLRLAGRFRKGPFGWKEDRVKLPLPDVRFARVKGTQVDLHLRAEGGIDQRLSLELFTPEAAGEFVEWLPEAKPWPHDGGEVVPVPGQKMLWVAVAGVSLTIVIVMAVLVLLKRRLY
jgi:hypothetical protein